MTDTELLDAFERHMRLAREARARGAEACAVKHEWAGEALLNRREDQSFDPRDHAHVNKAA